MDARTYGVWFETTDGKAVRMYGLIVGESVRLTIMRTPAYKTFQSVGAALTEVAKEAAKYIALGTVRSFSVRLE